MRRRQAIKRVHQTDPRFNSELVAKVIRTLMKSGKKTTAERIVYGAIEEVAKETGKDPLEVMDAAINNMKPKVEVKSRRVGGATYPVPVEIRPGRQLALALRWMAQYASARRGVPMSSMPTTTPATSSRSATTPTRWPRPTRPSPTTPSEPRPRVRTKSPRPPRPGAFFVPAWRRPQSGSPRESSQTTAGRSWARSASS